MESVFKEYSDYVVLIPGLLFAYWIYLKQKQIKELNFEVLTTCNVVEVHKKFKNEIEVRFKEKK